MLQATYFCKMKYQLGDEIIVLHTKEEGKVIELINDKMVLIEIRGVQFPAYIDQIDFPYFQRFTKKNKDIKSAPKKYIDQIQKEKLTAPSEINDEGVWLYLLPAYELDDFNDEVIHSFKIYLNNKNNQAYHFIYNQFIDDTSQFELGSQIHPHKDFYLHDIAFESFSDNPVLSFDMEMVNPDKTKETKLILEKKLRSKQIFKMAQDMRSRNEPVLKFELFRAWPNKKTTELKPSYKEINIGNKALPQKQTTTPTPRSVIDLHIDKITNEYKSLDNYTILQMQLDEFEKWYWIAIEHRMPNLTVIHGVGTGKLKDELHETLKSKKFINSFINQYHPAYGYGATEIYFKY